MTVCMDSIEPSVCRAAALVHEAISFKAAEAYARWGRGVHPAALNYGDCFAYVLAQQRACSLLFVGDDFAKTDIASTR
jgi:ribonuclease VapC